MMGKGIQGSDVNQVVEQLERHCLASDGSLISKSAFYDLLLAREEMCTERLRYLEAMAIYSEAIGMVEEYQQQQGQGQGLYPHLPLNNSPQVYEALEHRLIVAEAAQKLRLPLLSNDGDFNQHDFQTSTLFSPTSRDTTSPTFTISSTPTSTNFTHLNDPAIGGVPNRYLGITSAYLCHTHHHPLDMPDYQISLFREIEARFRLKCHKLADAFVMDAIHDSAGYQNQSSRLPERVKIIIEEIEREEEALKEDLYSTDRKFAEYYNVLEQILAVLIKLVKDLKLQNQHKYDELQKTWQIKRHEAMGAKLRALEHIFLVDTYTTETIPALHEIRKYLVKATEEASTNYKKAVTRLREYQGVDPHFDKIARQYHDIDKKLQNMQWTIEQVQMDLKSYPDHSHA